MLPSKPHCMCSYIWGRNGRLMNWQIIFFCRELNFLLQKYVWENVALMKGKAVQYAVPRGSWGIIGWKESIISNQGIVNRQRQKIQRQTDRERLLDRVVSTLSWTSTYTALLFPRVAESILKDSFLQQKIIVLSIMLELSAVGVDRLNFISSPSVWKIKQIHGTLSLRLIPEIYLSALQILFCTFDYRPVCPFPTRIMRMFVLFLSDFGLMCLYFNSLSLQRIVAFINKLYICLCLYNPV